MPRKPLKTKMKKFKRALTDSEIVYLSDDSSVSDENDYTLWCYRNGMPGFDGDPTPQELWEQHGEEFLNEFIERNPGKRPLPWWQWDAPRWDDPYEGVYFHGTLPEPRRRLGGSGTPKYEILNYVPDFHKGIPTGWIPETLDANDPPVFESETAYLLRHNLLTEKEKKYLEDHPELLTPEIFYTGEDKRIK